MRQSLLAIFVEGRPADKVIQSHMLSNRKWGAKDRKIFAEGVYDCVRWWRRLLHAGELPEGEVTLASITRVIEVWAAVNAIDLDRAVKKDISDPAQAVSRYEDPTLPRAVRESIPDWLDEWAATQLGAKWDEVLPILNAVAPVYLRANRLKTTPEKLRARLAAEGTATELAGPDGLRLAERKNVFLSPAFREGFFEVQDLNSQRVAIELAPKPGERVVDACAGAGGKSLHLAALMGGKGKIISMDVHDKKLEQLRERSTRAGATLIETRAIESRKTIKRLDASADRLLLDVPCTGLGVLRRNPDAKWRLTRAGVEELAGLQREILYGYVGMLKPGGTLVYATCSIMPRENGDVIKEFLSQNGTNFQLEAEVTAWPEREGADGFYFARLTKT